MKIILLLIFLSIFNIDILHSEEPLIIDFTNMKEMRLPLTLLGKKIEYIPLETTTACLLKNPQIYVTDKYIIAANMFVGVYLFDRKTGEFIHEISKKGNGPEEYSWMTIPGIFGFDEKRKIQFVTDFNKWKGFDIETNKRVITIKNPGFAHKGLYGGIANPFIYNDSTFLGYTNNLTGKSPTKLVLFNKAGEIKKVYPNHVFWRIKQ